MKTLSDKRNQLAGTGAIYLEEDVKQAIKDLKKELKYGLIFDDDKHQDETFEIIDKIFGVWEE